MKRLYFETCYERKFQATVESCEKRTDGLYCVTLDQTAFYPEGGGQPFDLGTLGQAKVVEVHDKEGQILHTIDRPLEPGSRVSASIDWDRRYQHMQSHSGEHLLSGLIYQHFGYNNVGFHMGKDEITIDFNGLLTKEQLAELELEANRKVYENIPIEVLYPSHSQLEFMKYRSKKELTGQVRIVRIAGGDTCACCGTHVRTTGEIGMIKTTGMIHYKGGVRISMLCGMKALNDYGEKLDMITGISNLLSAKPQLLLQAVDRVMKGIAEKDFKINNLYQQIFELKLLTIPNSQAPLFIVENDLTPVLLRKFCTLLDQQGKGNPVLVCSGKEEEYQYALGSSDCDMRTLGKILNEKLMGKGGGSSQMVQGTFHMSKEEINRVFSAAT